MAVAPGVAVRCNAGGAGAEAVVDLIEGFLHFFLFFLKKIIFLKKSIPLDERKENSPTPPGSVMIF
jgi:hypothetical protein